MAKIKDIITHFSGWEEVPIQVEDHVVPKLREVGVKDEFYFWDVEIEGDLLRGKVKHWEYPCDGGVKRVLDVSIDKSLTDDWRRLVSCFSRENRRL